MGNTKMRKQTCAENEIFHVQIKPLHSAVTIETVQGWATTESGFCRSAILFQVHVAGYANPEILEAHDTNEEWELAPSGNFAYKASALEMDQLQKMTPLPLEMVRMISQFCPNWQTQVGFQLLNDQSELKVNEMLGNCEIGKRVSRALLHFFRSFFHATEVLASGNSVSVPLAEVRWSVLPKINDSTEPGFWDGDMLQGATSSMIFKLEHEFVFASHRNLGSSYTTKRILLDQVLSNLQVRCSEWHHLTKWREHILIGCGTQFVHIGTRMQMTHFGWSKSLYN